MPAETKFAAMATPSSNQLARLFAHRHRHLNRALCRVGDRYWVIEKNHDAIARELVERALELGNERPQRAMISAQEVEHLLGLRGLGERGIAAQIAEHHDDLATMAFEDLLVALRNDQFSKLRCQKPLQPPDPAQFVDLLGNARFKPTV